MKKVSKTLSLVALCAVMIIMSVVPAFAAANDVTYMEDHSVVDCVHYYQNNGDYYYQIKSPKGQRDKVKVSITVNDQGVTGYDSLFLSDSYVRSIYDIKVLNSDEKYDYTLFVVKCSQYPDSYMSTWGGMGIKIFYYGNNNENIIMATNTANYSSEQGRGYWLNA